VSKPISSYVFNKIGTDCFKKNIHEIHKKAVLNVLHHCNARSWNLLSCSQWTLWPKRSRSSSL